MSDSLKSILRQSYLEFVISQAESIRDFHDSDERTQLAETHVREAMIMQQLGRITQDDTYRIFSILSFVMPSDAEIEGNAGEKFTPLF